MAQPRQARKEPRRRKRTAKAPTPKRA